MNLKELLTKTKDLNWHEKLEFIANLDLKTTFSTSFSVEDQIIFDFIAKNDLKIDVFAIDTGRLPEKTYEVWQKTVKKYKNKKIAAFYPDAQQIGEFVEQNGINSFYNDKDLRKSCCNIRKVQPLRKALKDHDLWVSGLRKDHSQGRDQKSFFEYDEELKIIKFYPVLQLHDDEIWKYIQENEIPYNELYDHGYKSIGCDPCSRAVKDGEDPRAGRWWWEEGDKECGLHMVEGKLVRKGSENKGIV